MLAVLLAVPAVAAASRDTEPPPDADFLEFLGSWQTRDGHWVDPLQVEDIAPGELENQRDSRQDRGKKPRSLGKDRNSADPMSEPYPFPEEGERSRTRDR